MPDQTNIWLWDAEAGAWVKAPADANHKRLTAAGAVASGHKLLHWMILDPSAVNSVVEISDDTDGSTAIVLDIYETTRDTFPFQFDPPMHFTNGIYLKTATNVTSVTFGYT